MLACCIDYHYHQNKLIYFLSFPCFDNETSVGSPQEAEQGADRDGINRIHEPAYRNKKRTDVLNFFDENEIGCRRTPKL